MPKYNEYTEHIPKIDKEKSRKESVDAFLHIKIIYKIIGITAEENISGTLLNPHRRRIRTCRLFPESSASGKCSG